MIDLLNDRKIGFQTVFESRFLCVSRENYHKNPFRSFLLTTKRNEPILRLSESKIKLVCFAEREQNQEIKKSRRQGARVAKN